MIFPTNQSKRTSENARTNEISRCKSQIKVQICGNRQRASERRVNEAISTLNPFKSLGEMPKVRCKK